MKQKKLSKSSITLEVNHFYSEINGYYIKSNEIQSYDREKIKRNTVNGKNSREFNFLFRKLCYN